MRMSLTILLMGVTITFSAAGATVYKCKSPDGVIFSGKPCGDKAEKLSESKSSGTTSATHLQSSAALTPVDIEKFKFLPNAREKIIERVGPPASSYTYRGTEYWQYPNAVHIEDGERACPELLLDDEGMFQINWLPEAVMRETTVAAARIAGWERIKPVVDKTFFMLGGGDITGKPKSEVVRRFSEPDAKKIVMGREWWEYERVTMSPDDPRRLTLFIEFDGDMVSQSAGN